MLKETEVIKRKRPDTFFQDALVAAERERAAQNELDRQRADKITALDALRSELYKEDSDVFIERLEQWQSALEAALRDVLASHNSFSKPCVLPKDPNAGWCQNHNCKLDAEGRCAIARAKDLLGLKKEESN